MTRNSTLSQRATHAAERRRWAGEAVSLSLGFYEGHPSTSLADATCRSGVGGIVILGRVILFFTAVLVALTAGRAFWVWLGENPANLSGATYVEFFQSLDRGIALPIAVTGIGGAVLAGISAILFRRDRPVFYLLLAACGLALVATIVTVSVHLPINARIATWNPTALPPNYREFLDRWWTWQLVRLVVMLAAMSLVFAAMLFRKEST